MPYRNDWSFSNATRHSPLLGAFEGATADRRQPTGTLRITAPADFPSSELSAAVIEFRNKYPQVKVETHISNRYVDLITEGFDIAIRGGHLEDSSLRSKRLGVGNLVVVASSRYLQGASAIQHPRDFAAHPCIGFSRLFPGGKIGDFQREGGASALAVTVDAQ